MKSYCSSTTLIIGLECLLIIDDKEHSLCVPEGRGSIELWKSFDGTHTLKSSDL